MLVLIGGAARTGKGILTRRLLAEIQLPYLSLDVLKMGLARGAPAYTIDPEAGALIVGEQLWPVVREMSINMLVEQVEYVLEGELLPQHVAALQQAYPGQIIACFLGYASISPEQKLAHIRKHAGYPNDWPRDYSDADLLKVIHANIAFSRYLLDECAAYHLPYFDTSDNFMQTLDQVTAYIKAAYRSIQP